VKYREPYVRWHSNRFGESQIVVPCQCGAGSSGTPEHPCQPPHAKWCPIEKKRMQQEKQQ